MTIYTKCLELIRKSRGCQEKPSFPLSTKTCLVGRQHFKEVLSAVFSWNKKVNILKWFLFDTVKASTNKNLQITGALLNFNTIYLDVNWTKINTRLLDNVSQI